MDDRVVELAEEVRQRKEITLFRYSYILLWAKTQWRCSCLYDNWFF